MTESLLPQNATALEKAVEVTLDTRQRVSPELAKIPTFTLDADKIPNDWLPWVIADEGLLILLPFLPPRDVLKEGRPWKLELGSSAAIKRAISWIGLSSTLHYEPDEDENFDLFQVELSAPVSPDAIPKIQKLVELSKPTTDVLARVFSGRDARPFRLDHSRLDGPDLLDDWSGVRLEEDGPVVSFDIVTSIFVDAQVGEIAMTSHAVYVAQINNREGFVLDQSKLDDEIVETPVVAMSSQASAALGIEVGTDKAPWPASPLPGHAWPDYTIQVFGE